MLDAVVLAVNEGLSEIHLDVGHRRGWIDDCVVRPLSLLLTIATNDRSCGPEVASEDHLAGDGQVNRSL